MRSPGTARLSAMCCWAAVKEALQWPAAARAVVVMIRGGEDDDTAFKGAAEGVVVMTVDPAVSWS